MHMDGVNGITQCPIAPNDSFVYNFTLTQYGSSWYHSHYSVQFADGAVGPMTIHGPSSAEWEEAISPPLIMTDWGHNTAFNAVTTRDFGIPDILLNGRGDVRTFSNVTNQTAVRPPYSITLEKPTLGRPCRKYLLRIINTSFDSTFVFSIDHHMLQIVSADFVPIQPYYNTSVLVGIGQRYNVIVEANPLVYNDTDKLPTDGNYWMRTYLAECGQVQSPIDGYEKTGILRYNKSSQALPSSESWYPISKDCSDETYTSLHPIVPWQVGSSNNGGDGDGELFNLSSIQPGPKPYPLAFFTLANEFQPGIVPLRIDYGNPTFLNLDNKGPWNPEWRIVPENYTEKDWVSHSHLPFQAMHYNDVSQVYLIIKGKKTTFGAHPVRQNPSRTHLHD